MVARTLLIHGSIPKESHMMHSRPTIAVLLAALSVGAAPSALADRRSDDANDGIRDDSLWRERESYRTSGSSRKKCKVSETAGAITFESQLGKGGGAAYLSAWRTDWTDSFSVTFDATFSAPASSKASRAAFSGIGFGFDAESAYNVAKGFRDGVQVEMQQTKAGWPHAADRGTQERIRDRAVGEASTRCGRAFVRGGLDRQPHHAGGDTAGLPGWQRRHALQ